ncbi:MAG: U32 family peptidase [Bacteroidaceae bacterium]|nr:U32 family peptidase [Bacteroidaceae bacterium]
MLQKLELLSPARNIEIGIEAINHGADAVYIGGPQFGARAAAGNSVADIKKLCEYAHIFGAKVYVTLNTVLYDNELSSTEALIHNLHQAGVDAIIAQDLAITQLNLPPIEIHASTQMDISSTSKAEFLQSIGFKQIVVARELSTKQINEIHEACPNVTLEAFVHGALCVSYSGRCYASQHCFKRSANRGECAQFCRLPFELIDADDKLMIKSSHLLSLRDMNRSNHLDAMIKAGVTSFKIEGRLKDLSYVKNVTAHYSKLLNEFIAEHPGEYVRSSQGTTNYNFEPQLDKSFNRSFTPYFITGKRDDVSNFKSPKSIGEHIGQITEFTPRYITVKTLSNIKLNAGDGLCFVDLEDQLIGFRANSILSTNQRGHFKILFGPNAPTWTTRYAKLPPKMYSNIQMYRNLDTQFEKELSKSSATRKLLLTFKLFVEQNAIYLYAIDELKRESRVLVTSELTIAKTSQQENMIKQLNKLGDTPYALENIEIAPEVTKFFIPSSLLANSRRLIIENILATNSRPEPKPQFNTPPQPSTKVEQSKLDYTTNITNSKAQQFYKQMGYADLEWGYEIKTPAKGSPIMFCKYCLKHKIGLCTKNRTNEALKQFKEPFYLRSGDGKKFRLSFDCKKCIMTIHPE